MRKLFFLPLGLRHEFGIAGQKENFDISDWSISLFCDNQLGINRLVFVTVF